MKKRNTKLQSVSGFISKTKKQIAKNKSGKHKHKGLLRDIGGGIGSMFGYGDLGKSAGSFLGDIFGWGDYDVVPTKGDIASNSLTGDFFTNQQPLMHSGDGTTRVTHREFVRDVDMNTFFDPLAFDLNPTNVNLFPWLSTVADNFEQYKFLGCVVGFRGQGSSSSDTGSLGSIAIATQYDFHDLPFSNKAEMLSTLFASSCNRTQNMLHAIECDPAKTPTKPFYTGINEVKGAGEHIVTAAGLGIDLVNHGLQLQYYGDASHTELKGSFSQISYTALAPLPLDSVFAVGDVITFTISMVSGTEWPTFTTFSRQIRAVNSNLIIVEQLGTAFASTLPAQIFDCTRTRTTPPSDDRMNNMGKIFLSAVGGEMASSIGEMWISYDVLLLKPSVIFKSQPVVEAAPAIHEVRAKAIHSRMISQGLLSATPSDPGESLEVTPVSPPGGFTCINVPRGSFR